MFVKTRQGNIINDSNKCIKKKTKLNNKQHYATHLLSFDTYILEFSLEYCLRSMYVAFRK